MWEPPVGLVLPWVSMSLGTSKPPARLPSPRRPENDHLASAARAGLKRPAPPLRSALGPTEPWALGAEGVERGGGGGGMLPGGRGVLRGRGRCGRLSWEEKRGLLALRARCFNQTGAASRWSGQPGLEQCELAPGSGDGGAAAE